MQLSQSDVLSAPCKFEGLIWFRLTCFSFFSVSREDKLSDGCLFLPQWSGDERRCPCRYPFKNYAAQPPTSACCCCCCCCGSSSASGSQTLHRSDVHRLSDGTVSQTSPWTPIWARDLYFTCEPVRACAHFSVNVVFFLSLQTCKMWLWEKCPFLNVGPESQRKFPSYSLLKEPETGSGSQ